LTLVRRSDLKTLTTVTAAGNVTTYTYDTENNLLGISDANSHATNFIRDAFGRVIAGKNCKEEIWLPGEDSNFQPFG
jgi:YD repeat-containing protein